MYADIQDHDKAKSLEADLRRCAAQADALSRRRNESGSETSSSPSSKQPSVNSSNSSAGNLTEASSIVTSSTFAPAVAAWTAWKGDGSSTDEREVRYETRHLLLCVNGSRTLELEQLILAPGSDDQVLFQDIRRTYKAMRCKRRLHPQIPESILQFVRSVDALWETIERSLLGFLNLCRLEWCFWWIGDSLFYIPKDGNFVRVST